MYVPACRRRLRVVRSTVRALGGLEFMGDPIPAISESEATGLSGVFTPTRARGADYSPICKTALALRFNGRKRHAICSRRKGPSCTMDWALDVAHLTIDALRRARAQYQCRGAVHLFTAVPVGLAFMIGQLLNTLGAVHTYEHVPGRPIPYAPAAVLSPSI